MDILILYATVEGQTEKIARFIEETVTRLGHSVEIVDADDPMELDLSGCDAAILAASVHQRRHPRNFEALLEGFRKELSGMKTLLVSVSLSAAFEEGLEDAADYVTEMKMRTGFEPNVEALVAGAVRTGHYDYFAMQVVRHVVLRGRDWDPNAGEHEFTDWDALEATVKDFVAEAG